MYTNEYNRALERLHTITELAKDLDNFLQSTNLLQHFSRVEGWNCLQKIIVDYREQIALCGLLEGIRLCYGVQLSQYSDQEIYNQLMYVARRIPIYVLVREGEKELGKKICEWLGGSDQIR